MRRITATLAPRFTAWLSAAAGLLMLTVAVLASPVHAVSADAFIREVGSETLQALGDRSLDQKKREAVVRKLLTEHLDMEAVGRFCLGRYSRSLNDTQQKEYIVLFQDYLVKVYSALLSQYNGETLTVQDGTREIEGAQLVSSQILRSSGPPIRVEWKLVDKAGQHKVTDVVVEGVSMAFTQRQQFESVIQNNGGRVQALFDAMKKQISR